MLQLVHRQAVVHHLLFANLAALSAIKASCAAMSSSSVMPDLSKRLAFFCVLSCSPGQATCGADGGTTRLGRRLVSAGRGLDVGHVALEA